MFRAALILLQWSWHTHGERGIQGVWGSEPPAGVQGQSSRWVSGGPSPPEADEVFMFKTLIFNTSAGALHQIMCYVICLFLPWSSQVYEFTVRICFLAIADQHLCIYTQVDGLCKLNKLLM